MNRSFSTWPLLAFSLLAATGGAPSREQGLSVDDVLQNNRQAVIGDSRIGKVRNIDLTLSIAEADYQLLARYRAADDGAMRIDVFSEGQRVFSEGKDELGVWEWPGSEDEPVNVTHDGVAALEHGVQFNLFTLAELQSRGHIIELVDQETIGGSSYCVLKVTLKDGFETYRYVNDNTWLVEISRDFRAFHPGIDAIRQNIETRYDQFERTDGILGARRSRNFNSVSEQLAETIILERKYNVSRADLDLERSHKP